MSVNDRLSTLGLVLPEPAAPAANYVPFVISGNQIFVSGQLPFALDGSGLAYQGKVGDTVSVEDAVEAARLCGCSLIAQVRAALEGDLERVTRVVRLGGFVNCIAKFDQQPAVINGASDLMVDVFGDKGRHARAAVGTNSLPFDVSVEIDGIFEFT